MTAVVACDVPSAGECLVSAHLLREILAAMRGEVVELTLDDSRLKVACGKSEYRLGVMRLDEYPSLPKFPKPVGKVARDDLADLIGTVEHAAGRDDSVAVLTAVRVVGEDARLRAQCTDRFRIADAGAPWQGEGTFEALIPVASLTAALKGLRGPVAVGYDDSNLFGLSDGSRTVTTRCLEQDYPKLDRLMKVGADVTVTVDAEVLAEALKRANLVNEPLTPTTLTISAEEIALHGGSDTGDADEYVLCEASGDFTVGFNAAFLAQGLASIGGQVRMSFTDERKPVLIESTDEAHDARSLVMPRKSLR